MAAPEVGDTFNGQDSSPKPTAAVGYERYPRAASTWSIDISSLSSSLEKFTKGAGHTRPSLKALVWDSGPR
ncbi:hypothetical protein Ct61P_12141 [Colletotrichum tofieldiae]|nr:hypothetical protein Ct61P_12141 [Colletotrichum tofieldiae]